MAPSSSSSFSLLLRHFSLHHRHHRHPYFLSPLIRNFSLSSSHQSSTTTAAPAAAPSTDSPKPSSLSARLSFVFDKIDEIEKDRAEKDDALQRIRAWRESKKKLNQLNNDSVAVITPKNDELGLGFIDSEEIVERVEEEEKEKVGLMKKEIELAHPWNEWIALMERLGQQNYFDFRRKDEDKMIQGLGGSIEGFAEEQGFDFTRDWKTVNAAIVNFGKDRFDILRSLSRQDIQTLVGYGCPSADKKVVFSSKLLRKHAHLDEGDVVISSKLLRKHAHLGEGDVCSSCSLRNNCERAYLVTNKEDEARTIDLMRVLLTYGFDSINGSVENKFLLKQKSVKTAVRKVLHEVVRLSAVLIDPNLPPPVIKKRPPKVKQPPPPPKRRVGRDDIEMKKGDWLCPKCNFMNFAKNTVCLQCDSKRPKRQLLPGEWECPQCNFLNYRRNMTCFNCEHKRPPDEYMEDQMQGRQQRQFTRQERAPNRDQLSNAWNFDFDDDESDGADVAAFEYADANVMNEDNNLDSPLENGSFRRPQEVGRTQRLQEREPPRHIEAKHNMGFDDFDDDYDDIDSYEIDNQNRSDQQKSSIHFSDVENDGYSDVEDEDLPGYSKSSRSSPQKRSLSDSGDDDMDLDLDKDLPIHPKWKSSHVADSGFRNKAPRGLSKRMSFGSDDDDDDELVFGSDNDIEEDLKPRQRRDNYYDSDESGFQHGEKLNYNRKQSGIGGHKRGKFVKGSDSDDDFGRSPRSNRGNQRGSFDNARGGRKIMSGGIRGGPRGSFDEPRGRQNRSDGPRGSQRDSFGNSRGRHSTNRIQRGAQTYSGSRQPRAGYGGRGGRSNESDYNWSEQDRPLRQRRNINR